jgi:dipeptide/tripeptide permease
MGIWFLGPSLGNKLAGMMAGHFDEKNTDTLVHLYGAMFVLCLVAAVVLIALCGKVRKLMVDVK